MLVDEYNKELGRINKLIKKLDKREELEDDISSDNLDEVYKLIAKAIKNISSETIATNLTLKGVCGDDDFYRSSSRIVLWKKGLGVRYRFRTQEMTSDMLIDAIKYGGKKIIAEMKRLNRRTCIRRIRIAQKILKSFPNNTKRRVYEFKHTIATNIDFGSGGDWHRKVKDLKIKNLSFSDGNIELNDGDITLYPSPTDYVIIQNKYDEIMELLENDIARLRGINKEQKKLVRELEKAYSRYFVAFKLAEG